MPRNNDPFRDLERLASTLLESPDSLRHMPMDLYRDADHYVLSADLPGVDPGSVDVDVDGQLLTIRAERTLADHEGVSWITRERRPGSFLRQLNIGRGIDVDGITATYDNGVLTVSLPVSERAKPRKIAVSPAADRPSAGAIGSVTGTTSD